MRISEVQTVVFIFVCVSLFMHNVAEAIICQAGAYNNTALNRCVECPKRTFSESGAACLPCPDGYFAYIKGSANCTKCGSGTTSTKNKDGCDYNGCVFRYDEYTVYDLSNLKRPRWHKIFNDSDILEYPRISTDIFFNICPAHDNRNKKDTMVRDRYFGPRSLGRILNFLPLKGDERIKGLLLKITGGDPCWNSEEKRFQDYETNIFMHCGDSIEFNPSSVLNPGPVLRAKKRACKYDIDWTVSDACPVCPDGKSCTKLPETLICRKERKTFEIASNDHPNKDYTNLFVYVDLCPTKEDHIMLITLITSFSVLAITIIFVGLVCYCRKKSYCRRIAGETTGQVLHVNFQNEE